MTQEKAGLGEQALNKMAEIALSTQMEEADKLTVQVKTDPSKLARGEVESIAIDGEGLVMQPDLRVEELELQIGRVTVKPLSAIFGKIELTQPSSGTVRIVLNEDNINSALNAESFHKQLGQMLLQKGQVQIDRHIGCSLQADGRMALNAKIVSGAAVTQRAAFTVMPQADAASQGIVLNDIQQTEGKDSPLTEALLAKTTELLNLRNLEMEGMSLRIQQVDVEAGRMTLQGEAYIENFPSA